MTNETYVKFFTRDGNRMPRSEFYRLAEMADYDADTLNLLAAADDWRYQRIILDLQDYIDLAYPGRLTD